MARNTPISSVVTEAEYITAKYKFVFEHFPDCKIQKSFNEFIASKPVFISKMVNNCYTHLDFIRGYSCLNVIPYCKLDFTHNDKTETITINSSPKRSRLVRVATRRNSETKAWESIIKFSRLAINLKNNNFDDKMLNECRAHIMTFIKNNPQCKLDNKHLEPRLKKLLIFT